uniref:hypothetical protein n=1 Tax=Gracilaria urvillei TaxID=172974 RepID=UPI001D1069DD|nr:hypothetical protein LK147_pgp127 [Hydropuntia urvillei]UAD88413.1 hypothetical protein [Hydropuntia urvillei]
MESLQYINKIQNDLNIDGLSLETPIGWSSTCFDETISYYIECNSYNHNYVKTEEKEDIVNN